VIKGSEWDQGIRAYKKEHLSKTGKGKYDGINGSEDLGSRKSELGNGSIRSGTRFCPTALMTS
jgi:hypothetical protein